MIFSNILKILNKEELGKWCSTQAQPYGKLTVVRPMTGHWLVYVEHLLF